VGRRNEARWPLTCGAVFIQVVHPLPEELHPVLAFQECRWHHLDDGIQLVGLDDIHGMGLIEGLHHLDAKAVVSAEEHRVVDGASDSAPLFGSHAGPRTPVPGE